jgi:AraC-like DNA-binding protein
MTAHPVLFNPALFQSEFAAVSPRSVAHEVVSTLATFDSTHVRVGQIAARLRINRRTLQWQLAREGFTFRKLLNRWKTHCIVEKLATTNLPMTEISHHFAFSDPSAFCRFVKSMTGASPSEIRRNARGRPSVPTSAPSEADNSAFDPTLSAAWRLSKIGSRQADVPDDR